MKGIAMKKIIVIWLMIPLSLPLLAQHLSGKVYGVDSKKSREILVGVNVYWANTREGTVTDVKGHFHLEDGPARPHQIVFSFVGYRNDTILITKGMAEVEAVLNISAELEGVEVVERAATTFISRKDPIFTQVIGTGELQKAACCNLSESFETSASVDVNYSDAVSGAKQIKLLGLAGKYSLIQTENIPNLRGLGNTFGLNYIPGPWMESIQVSKGAASVKNGYESTTGQINIEYKKPGSEEKLHINSYVNDAGKLEGNANLRWKVNEKLSSMFFLHSEHMSNKIDKNKDGFLDLPLLNQVNFMNRWEYSKPGKRHIQLGIKVLDEQREAGQASFYENNKSLNDSSYQIMINTRRYEIFSKNGFIFQNRPGTSIGIIASLIYHDQESKYGFTEFDGTQYSGYLNAMYESYLWNTTHIIKMGFSTSYDKYEELFKGLPSSREEIVPGVFSEYSFSPTEKFTFLAGLRADFHNIYGDFLTPRLHLRYAPDEKLIFRASAGKGYRTPYLIAENPWILASSRELVVLEETAMEEAWNYGVNISKYVDLLGRELRISLDAYRTDFQDQLIVDLDRDEHRIYAYNLIGRSFANSIQLEAHYEILRNLEMTLAMRINDVRVTTDGTLQEKPLVDKYKALLNLSWQSAMKRWQADLTAQFNGPARLPSTSTNPLAYQRGEESPSYTMILGQLTHYFKVWSVYLGVENLLDYVQKNPIIAADQPYSSYFDAASSWGPIHGRKVYAGFRYTLK